MARLSEVARPFLISVVVEREPERIRAALESSRAGGAGAVELNLAQIAAGDLGAVREIAAACELPVYTACRSAGFMRVYGFDSGLDALDDAARTERQLAMLGPCCAVDVEFEGSTAVIEHVHAMGFEAIVSRHAEGPLTAGETLVLARRMSECGADFVKIIQRHSAAVDRAELWRAAMFLREHLAVPFVLLSMGPGEMFVRWMACHLGSSYAFVRPPGATRYYAGHPPLDEMRALWSVLPPDRVR